jgi:hypothetical protein
MSYAPHQRNTSGIVFFGEQGNQPTFYSDSNFLVQDGAAGHIQAPNLIIGDGGNIGSVTDPDSIAIASNGNVTMSQSLSITGDLTVNGTTTTVNSTVVTIEDPIIILGQDSSSTNPYGSDTDDNKDRGVAFAWNINGNGPSLGFFGHDDSIQGFTYISSGTVTGEVFSGSPGWAVFHAVSGNLVGDVTGNADTATTLETTRTFAIAGEGTAAAQNFNGSQNVSLSFALDSTAITNRTAAVTPDNADLILVYDDSTSSLRKMTRANFVSGLGTGSMDSFQVKGDLGSTHTINDGDVFVLTGGSGIQVYGSGTDSLAISMKIDQSTLGYTADVLEVQDGGITATQLATSVAGNGLTGGGGTALAVGAGSLSDVTANTVDVDLTEAAAATIASGDFLIFLDGGANGAASKGSTADLATLLTGNGLTVTGSTLSVGAGSLIDVTATTVDVDLTEAAAATIADNDYLIFLDGGATGAESKGSTRDLATLMAGNGLSATNSALELDFSELSVGVVNSGDSFAILNADGSTEERITISQLGSWLAGTNVSVSGDGKLNVTGGFSNFIMSDGTTTQTVDDGETMLFNDSTRINFTVASGNALTADLIANTVSETYLTASVAGVGIAGGNGTALTLDLSEYSTAAVGAGDSFLMLDNNGSTEQRSTVAQLGTYLAGDNITNTAGVLSVADSDIEAAIFTAANFVDSTTIDFTVTAGASVTAIVKDSSITEAKRSRSVVVDTVTGTLASTDDVSLVNATAAPATITLTGVATSGKRVTIKKTDSSANAVTIARDGSSTIDGATTKILYSQYESITVISDGTNWHII